MWNRILTSFGILGMIFLVIFFKSKYYTCFTFIFKMSNSYHVYLVGNMFVSIKSKDIIFPLNIKICDSLMAIKRLIEMHCMVFLGSKRVNWNSLHVTDRPDVPTKAAVERCKDRNATIVWTPGSYNNAPVQYFIIQYNTSFTPDTWTFAKQVCLYFFFYCIWHLVRKNIFVVVCHLYSKLKRKLIGKIKRNFFNGQFIFLIFIAF